MHLFSPLSQGLFRSVVAFSGSALNFWANRVVGDHLIYARRQAEEVGCPTKPSEALIECLRTVDAATLTLVQPLLFDFFGGTVLSFEPIGTVMGYYLLWPEALQCS